MSDRGVVYDLGYKPHEGPRLGTASAIRATIMDGIRRVLGLRRRARKKVLPWLLVALAVIPAVVIVGLSFFLPDFDGPAAGDFFGGHREVFSWVGTIVLLFTALAAPELLIPDREEGVLAVYSSRPLRARDYLMARGAALAATLGFLMLVPQLLMYVSFAALSSDGLAESLVENADDLLQIVLTVGVYVVGYGAPALFVATFARRIGPATGTYLAVMLALDGIVEAVADSGSSLAKAVALAGLREHPSVVRDWIFGVEHSRGHSVRDVGWDPWVSLAVICAVALAAMFVASRRYRSEI